MFRIAAVEVAWTWIRKSGLSDSVFRLTPISDTETLPSFFRAPVRPMLRFSDSHQTRPLRLFAHTATEMQGFAQVLADSIRARIRSGRNIFDQGGGAG